MTPGTDDGGGAVVAGCGVSVTLGGTVPVVGDPGAALLADVVRGRRAKSASTKAKTTSNTMEFLNQVCAPER